MNLHVSRSCSRQSGGHSVSGGMVSTQSSSLSRLSWSRVFSATAASRAGSAASPGSTTSSDSTLGTVDVGTDSVTAAGPRIADGVVVLVDSPLVCIRCARAAFDLSILLGRPIAWHRARVLRVRLPGVSGQAQVQALPSWRACRLESVPLPLVSCDSVSFTYSSLLGWS